MKTRPLVYPDKDNEWELRARDEGLPDWMITFCSINALVCRLSVQADKMDQIYVVKRRTPATVRLSNGFYIASDGTPADLIAHWKLWSAMHDHE